MPKIWTEEEHNIFREMYPNNTRKQMAKYFNVSESSIQNKARRLGVTVNVQDKDRGNINIFENINSEESAYWLGFIYADGYIIVSESGRNFELGIELSTVDIDHLNKFNSIFNDYYKVKVRKRSMDKLKTLNKNHELGRFNTMCNIRIYSKKVVKDLEKNGVVQNKTNSDIFPKIKDKELFFHFLRGFIDGDGSYHLQHVKTCKRVISYPRINMTGNNKLFFEYLVERLGEYNIKPTIYKDGNSWKLEIGRYNDYKKVVNYMFKNATIYLERKYQKIKEIEKVAVLNRNI